MASTPSDDRLALALAALGGRFGCSPETRTAERLLDFCRLLLTWNQKINLTGARSIEELLAEHLPDAFAMAGLVPQGARIIDVGSGGGLPALPFAILRADCTVALVEPRARRAAFLRAAIRDFALRATVVESRLENLSVGAPFDVASSRATFAPSDWLAAAPRLVRPGGCVLVFTTPAEAAGLASTNGMASAANRVAYELTSGPHRVLLAFDVPRGTPAL